MDGSVSGIYFHSGEPRSPPVRPTLEAPLHPCDASCLTITESYAVWGEVPYANLYGASLQAAFGSTSPSAARAAHGAPEKPQPRPVCQRAELLSTTKRKSALSNGDVEEEVMWHRPPPPH